MKTVICAIAKYEYEYIKEWVSYHIDLGFDKIVIYDNNDINGEKYDTLLSDFIENDQVELRSVRGMRAMQREVYNEFYHEGDFDWVAIIDIDEFITINKSKYKNIKEFIEKKSNADAIWLYWQTFGDSGKTKDFSSSKKYSVLKTFNKPAEKTCLIDNALKIQNAWGKSIIKKGLNIKYLHEHFVTDPSTLNYVDCFGKPVSPYLYFPDNEYVEKTYKEGYIKHIYTKSLQEYIEHKVKRPAANSMGIMHFPSKYFKVNEVNEEKRKYLESIGYKMEFVFKPDTYVIIEVKNFYEYKKLKPYILNIINLCCCRFNICVTEDQSAVSKIEDDISFMFNECAIYYVNKGNTLSEFYTIFDDYRKNIVEKTNCIVHINIPFSVDMDNYISDFIDPIFNKNDIENNFVRLLNTDDAIFVSEKSIYSLDKNSEFYKKFSNLVEECNMNFISYTGNFIIKTHDALKHKDFFEKNKNELSDPELILYFISNICNSFIFAKTNKNE